MTLIEILVATAIAGLMMIVLTALMFYSARSFAALTNYVDLDQRSRNALDSMTSEIRQVDTLKNFGSTRLEFEGTNPNNSKYTLIYTYNPTAKTLTKSIGGVSTVLLSECQSLEFAIFKRNPKAGTQDLETADPSRPDLVKAVQLSWICSRNILGKKANTESVQSARVVIRKQEKAV
jgi:type II secretory pathway pseudopilin PulG